MTSTVKALLALVHVASKLYLVAGTLSSACISSICIMRLSSSLSLNNSKSLLDEAPELEEKFEISRHEVWKRSEPAQCCQLNVK